MRAERTWGEAEAARALDGGASASDALRLGLPWAGALLESRCLRGLAREDREDLLQGVWLAALALGESIRTQSLRAALELLLRSAAGRLKQNARRERRRTRAWEEARGKGENEWP